MESSWKKPASKMVKGRNQAHESAEESADIKDAQEALAAKEKRAQQEKANEDKVAQVFGGGWFITNWTNPVLIHPTLPQLTVTRFYPDQMVAVDIFPNIDPWDEKVIAYKREVFKKNEVEHGGVKGKVRYGALSYADPLAKLLPQLEE